ncbi:MAG: hypothetical protein JWQ48_1934 [Conexibacter sp.]|nr:hypothetical protein [Conexibacter sp.]
MSNEAESNVGATELSVQGESLQRLYSQYTQGLFLVNRRYQRKLVWAVEEKAKLIDSVLKRLPIPLILLAESTHEGASRLEVIDGLQRLNALFSFIENEFAVDGYFFDLETLADTKLLKDQGKRLQRTPVLGRTECRDLANYQLPVSTYRSASEASVDEVFRRINSSGRYLSLQEIRQAGSTAEIASLVRRISAAVRGDASFTDYVSLEDMPKISITNKDLDYGIYDSDIFWVRQGILSREAVRESRDEELVLDILLDLILKPIASSGSEYRNAAYGDERGPASTSASTVRSRLLVLGPQEAQRRFMATLDLLTRTLDVAGTPYATLTVTQQNPRGVPRHFHALFVACSQLVHDETLTPKSLEGLAEALSGFWDRDLTIPGGGNWGGDRKAALIEAVKGYLRPSFVPNADEHQVAIQEEALRFESTLRMVLTEHSMFELKQGYCQVSDSALFDDASFAKIMKTTSAMANKGAGARGIIFIGVADDEEDARAIERFTGVASHRLDRFFITGTQHELDALGRSVDEQFRWLIERIKSSKLDQSFADALASTLTPFRYKEYLLWKLEPVAGSAPVTYDSKFFERHGPMTVEVSEPGSIVDLVRRFPNA